MNLELGTRNFGGEFLIHAGKSIDKEAMERFKYLNLEYKTGVILGKCTLEDCLLVDDKLKEELTEKESSSILWSNSFIKKRICI